MRSRQLALITLVFVTLNSCGSPASTNSSDEHGRAVVTSVIDGDTIVVRFTGGGEESVRLLGVDTPETVDPNRPEQCFGSEASNHVSALLPPGTSVRLERDVEARDHFGRLLAHVFRDQDDLFVNLDLVRRGLADISIYAPNDAYVRELEAASISARTQSLGLWGVCGGPDVPIVPRDSD